MTRNFKAKVIQLDFDEYFKLNNQFTEISMSPTPARLPEYKVRQKSIIVTFKDSLEKNTTYVINFGKSIADVNEGNILKNFTYVFSTGIHIDSLSVSGRVINNATGEREKDVTVMLFTLKQDSLLFGKKRPTIFTTTDTSGNFSLDNLHPDDYRIYALKQGTSANKIYNSDKDLIAFDKKIVHLTTDIPGIQLKLFKETPEKFRPIKSVGLDGKILFTFNKSLDNPSLKITYPPDFDQYKIVDFSKTKDTAALFMKNMDFDSLRVAFFDNGKPLDTIFVKKGKKETFTRAPYFTYNLSSDSKLKPGTDLILKGNFPMDTFDPSLINLKEDSTDVSNFTVQKDTGDTKTFILKYRWKQTAKYTIILNEGAFTDIYGDKNKRLPLRRFTIDKPENYSLLTLKVTVPDTGKSYIVQLLNSKKDILRKDVITKNTSLVYKNYLTGKYSVSVVYDDNKNGKWDSGNVKKQLQPENIWADPEIITLRPNWEQETPVSIPPEPLTP